MVATDETSLLPLGARDDRAGGVDVSLLVDEARWSDEAVVDACSRQFFLIVV